MQLDPEPPGCFQWFKDTKMKANHNNLEVAPESNRVVSNGSKIGKLARFRMDLGRIM